MVAKWREGYDVVLAARKDRSSDSWEKRSTASAFYRVMGRLSSVDITSNEGDFRLMERRAVAVICQYRERQRLLKGLLARSGTRQVVAEYARPGRSTGKTKFRTLRSWGPAMEGII